MHYIVHICIYVHITYCPYLPKLTVSCYKSEIFDGWRRSYKCLHGLKYPINLFIPPQEAYTTWINTLEHTLSLSLHSLPLSYRLLLFFLTNFVRTTLTFFYINFVFYFPVRMSPKLSSENLEPLARTVKFKFTFSPQQILPSCIHCKPAALRFRY